ncbi:MAG: hypothetical protein O6947_06235 [Acidobacteria bacterium]|nr:hypothetical protein [Acidobacteriota bacterium]
MKRERPPVNPSEPPEVEFLCPACHRRNQMELWTSPCRRNCRHCGETLPLERGAGEDDAGPIGVCGVCGGRWLYLQRDFNQKIGCGIVLVGILLSVPTYGLSLVAAAILDLFLYRRLAWVTVCYYCQAHYRGVRIHPSHKPYDLQIGETTTIDREKGITRLRNLPAPQSGHRG